MKHDDQNRRHRNDLIVSCLGQEFSFEFKSLDKKGRIQLKNGDTLDYDINGHTFRTGAMPRGRFDILGVNTFNVTGTWDFIFIDASDLPDSKNKKIPEQFRHHFIQNTIDPKSIVTYDNPFDLLVKKSPG